MADGTIELDIENYSAPLKLVIIAGVFLFILTFFKSPIKPTVYDDRCFVDTCLEKCQELQHRFGHFEYTYEIRCICKTNITEIPIMAYSIKASDCPKIEKNRRCDSSYCETACVKEKGFLPYHSTMIVKDNEYVCVCEDKDVGWYEEPYSVAVELCGGIT